MSNWTGQDLSNGGYGRPGGFGYVPSHLRGTGAYAGGDGGYSRVACRTDVYEDLHDCIRQLARHESSEKVRYGLLVNQQGMAYDANRLGADCNLVAASGRPFTFSVRRDDVGNRKILLAIAWR